jgi:hypothetical protein
MSEQLLRAVIEDQSAEISRLRTSIERLLVIVDHGMPEACGDCGSDWAECDANCQAAVYAMEDVQRARAQVGQPSCVRAQR